MHEKSVFLTKRIEPRTFKAVDGRTLKSPGEVQISPTLNTMTAKYRLRNLCARIIPHEDANVVSGAASAGEIVLGNHFLVKADLGVTKLRRRKPRENHLYHLWDSIVPEIDYKNWETDSRVSRFPRGDQIHRPR